MANKKLYSLRIDVDILEDLRQMAELQGVSVSELMHQAFKGLLGRSTQNSSNQALDRDFSINVKQTKAGLDSRKQTIIADQIRAEVLEKLEADINAEVLKKLEKVLKSGLADNISLDLGAAP